MFKSLKNISKQKEMPVQEQIGYEPTLIAQQLIQSNDELTGDNTRANLGPGSTKSGDLANRSRELSFGQRSSTQIASNQLPEEYTVGAYKPLVFDVHEGWDELKFTLSIPEEYEHLTVICSLTDRSLSQVFSLEGNGATDTIGVELGMTLSFSASAYLVDGADYVRWPVKNTTVYIEPILDYQNA